MKVKVKVKKARMQMLPLLDVIFLVTVFLAYSMMDMTELGSIDVILPEVANSDISEKPDFVLTIMRDGAVSFDGQTLELSALAAMLGSKTADGSVAPDQLAVVYADRNATVQDVVAVLDIINGSGLHNIAFQVKRGRDF